MLSKFSIFLVFVLLFSPIFEAVAFKKHGNITGIELPNHHMSFNAVSSSSSMQNTDCSLSNSKKDQNFHSVGSQENEDVQDSKQTVKLDLKHRWLNQKSDTKSSFIASRTRDLTRIQTLHKRITEKKNQSAISRLNKDNNNKQNQNQKQQQQPVIAPSPEANGLSGQLMATLESGVSLGSGEYFMDVFIGTPPKHFSLILDTGSDLNWIQSVPCYDCFEQTGPYYDPKDSSSFSHITCNDPKCNLVSSPDPPQPCKSSNQTCPYFYWYGDSSNTTGDFALETFTVNLTSSAGKSEFKRVKNVMFGCGHWNRGLFHGAAGLLGLGRGPLSFSSQLQSLYGHSFSYCLVDRNSDANVSSKLIFGEDKNLMNHPELNFTSFVGGKDNPVDTFYYVQIKSIIIGGEILNIPEQTWNLSAEGSGGTIVDSGTTLSYFAEPAYEIIRDKFIEKIKGYPILKDFPILNPCYNVSGVERMELPEFGIIFRDGAVWNFPVENYFIRLDPEEVVCLAILGTPRSALSIIGNYQQQNFHILYDTKKSRLGYAPMNCAEV
ncbi:aspartyl protease family protein 2-like [Mercurialis annua]|uniref:aspartyl protease family protein 2-like n=1 Tax=Mercurialis annua TaxID=3986 RepID=UPI0021607F6C|nr:aspartyl protease family protein 2-like [Mercurialis annua]